MEFRVLNHTSLTVSRACLGTMTFGSQTDRETACHLLHCAFDAGINFVDTANAYTSGESERLLGDLLGPHRHSVVLASKIGMKVEDETPGLSRDAVTAAVENSLKRLRTDYLDICYLHLPDANVPIEESLEAMDALVRAGKVRYPGSSNFASWQVCQMVGATTQRGLARVSIAQPMYNLLARRIEDEFLPACRELGVSVVAYNPLAGGLLTGKHNGRGPIAGTRFHGNKAYLDRYWNDANLDAVASLQQLADNHGRSLVSVALNWMLHHTPVDCVILGASSGEQLCQNLSVLEEGALDGAVVEACDELWKTLRGPSPKYNR
jgi:aryl-alcohol dehydrogenase-like predicted oxidoreductase